MGWILFGHRFDGTHSSEDIREQYSKYEHDELENLEDKGLLLLVELCLLERWERPLSLVFKIRLVRCKYIFHINDAGRRKRIYLRLQILRDCWGY